MTPDPPDATIFPKSSNRTFFPEDIPEDDDLTEKYQLPKRSTSPKRPKKSNKGTRYDNLISSYATARELFHYSGISHWNDPELLPQLLSQAQILGIPPAMCYLNVDRITNECQNAEAQNKIRT